MITEAYCSFEVSKLLKEKGFDGLCCGIWHINNEVFELHYEPLDYSALRDEILLAPTHQMAMAWLREEKGIFISIGVGTDIDDVFGYMPSIYFLSILACNEGRFSPNVDADDICDYTPKNYDQAVEAALEYVLKNLI